MSKVNIVGLITNDDPCYRYKMNSINVSIEKGKTVITNFNKICEDINRDVKLILNYFKKYFGTNFTLQKGKASTTKNIMKSEFQQALNEFIENGVICKSCRLPETVIKSTGTEILMKCACCGFNGKLDTSTIDNKHVKDVLLSTKGPTKYTKN